MLETAGLSASVAQATLNSEIITGTLDALNSWRGASGSASSDMAQSYNFNQEVLSSFYNPVGTVVSTLG